MNGQKVVPLVLTFLGAVGALLCSFGLLQATATALPSSAPYLDAPLFTGGDDPVDFDGRLVWARGSLVPAAADAFLVSPYAETTCLAYVSEKLRGGWGTDGDGDRYRTWTVEQNVRRAVPMNLRVGGVFLKVDANGARFLNEVKVVDRERTVDGADYRFTEHIIPVTNTVWAVGRLRGTTFTAADRGLLLSLDAPEPATRHILGEAVLFLYFAALLGMVGLGCLAGFASFLLRGRLAFPQPSTVVVVCGAAVFSWTLAGGMLASLDAGTPVPLIPISMVAGAFGLLPLLAYKGRPRFPHVLYFLIPVVAMALGAGWCFDHALLGVSGRWLLPAGIILFLGAVALYLVWHYKTKPRPAR